MAKIGTDTLPPAITITATPDTLWPPNGKMVSVTLTGTITDADSGVDPSAATYTVMDDYKLVQPQGSFIPAANGSYAFTIHLQASRNGSDKDGRQYTITVRAEETQATRGQRPPASLCRIIRARIGAAPHASVPQTCPPGPSNGRVWGRETSSAA